MFYEYSLAHIAPSQVDIIVQFRWCHMTFIIQIKHRTGDSLSLRKSQAKPTIHSLLVIAVINLSI